MNRPKYGEKVPTGIPGLDELIEGGFPKNSRVLVVAALEVERVYSAYDIF